MILYAIISNKKICEYKICFSGGKYSEDGKAYGKSVFLYNFKNEAYKQMGSYA